MKYVLGVILILVLPFAVFARDPDLVFSGTHGNDIIFGLFEEQGAKLNPFAFRTDPAPGTVGFTIVVQTGAGSDTFDVFYSYTNSGNNKPSLARNTYDISNITDGTSNTILLSETKPYPTPLGDYDVSFWNTILPYLSYSPAVQPQDPFFRAVNSSSNPSGPQKKLFDLPPGISSVRTNFSEDGTAGASAFLFQNRPSLFTYKCPSDAAPKVETVNRFVTQSQIVDFQWSNRNQAGTHSFIYREIRSSGNQFKTFVGARRFEDGRPVGNINVVNPLSNISGPGSGGYANAYFGQVATDPNGSWFLWAAYPSTCPEGEWYSRCYNPQNGTFCGGKSKVFGNCNFVMADGSVRQIRSMDVTRWIAITTP